MGRERRAFEGTDEEKEVARRGHFPCEWNAKAFFFFLNNFIQLCSRAPRNSASEMRGTLVIGSDELYTFKWPRQPRGRGRPGEMGGHRVPRAEDAPGGGGNRSFHAVGPQSAHPSNPTSGAVVTDQIISWTWPVRRAKAKGPVPPRRPRRAGPPGGGGRGRGGRGGSSPAAAGRVEGAPPRRRRRHRARRARWAGPSAGRTPRPRCSTPGAGSSGASRGRRGARRARG